MKGRELQNAIETAIGEVAFDPPISPDYCEAVMTALRPKLPKGSLIDVYHRNVELVVDVRAPESAYVLTLPLV